jgi:RHS repeat-associated protein
MAFVCGFNGKENDKDAGERVQDYGMRIYDGRLGRFLSVDPLTKTFPYYSPYHFASNSPIKFLDLDGGEPQDYVGNWKYKDLYQIWQGGSRLVGGWMEVTSAKLGRIDVDMVYDKSTKQYWFVYSDNRGNYYFLKNNDGVSKNMWIKNGKHNNWLTGGEFEKFETRNQREARLGNEFARGFAITVFATTTAIAGAFLIEGALASAGGTQAIGSIVRTGLINTAKKGWGVSFAKEFSKKLVAARGDITKVDFFDVVSSAIVDKVTGGMGANKENLKLLYKSISELANAGIDIKVSALVRGTRTIFNSVSVKHSENVFQKTKFINTCFIKPC